MVKKTDSVLLDARREDIRYLLDKQWSAELADVDTVLNVLDEAGRLPELTEEWLNAVWAVRILIVKLDRLGEMTRWSKILNQARRLYEFTDEHKALRFSTLDLMTTLYSDDIVANDAESEILRRARQILEIAMGNDWPDVVVMVLGEIIGVLGIRRKRVSHLEDVLKNFDWCWEQEKMKVWLSVNNNFAASLQTLKTFASAVRFWKTGKIKSAFEEIEVVHDNLESVGLDDNVVCGMFLLIGSILSDGNAHKQAQDVFAKSGHLADKNGDYYTALEAAKEQGLNCWYLCEYYQAEALLTKALQTAKILSVWRPQVELNGHLALVYLSQYKLDLAINFSNEHLRFAENCGWDKEKVRAIGNRGTIVSYRRDATNKEYEASLSDLLFDVEANHGEGPNAEICAMVGLSICYMQLKRDVEAAYWIEKAKALISTGELEIYEIMVNRCAARLLPDLSKQQRQELLLQSLTAAKNTGKRLDQAACLLSLSSLEPNEKKKKKLWLEGQKILKNIGAQRWLDGYEFGDDPLILMLS